MSTQLRLLEGGRRPDWKLDARMRRIGRQGIAAARAALDRADRPQPPSPLRKAS